MQRILLIGKNGQLGQELMAKLTGEVIGLGREELDLTNSQDIHQILSENQPQIIINSAAYTAVDKAESEKDLAYQINAIAPQIIAQEARKLGADLIHISTDYVFDGSQSTPYQEGEITNPLGVYGASKLAGENAIIQSCEKYLILRTAWVYGIYGKTNFVKTMLRLGHERETVRIVYDQIGSPTWAADIAQTICQLIHMGEDVPTGIYHFTNSGVASWYDFAKAIFEEVQNLGVVLKVQEVVPITTLEYPTPAKRPAYSVLSTQKLRSILGSCPPYWRDSLKQMLNQLIIQEQS